MPTLVSETMATPLKMVSLLVAGMVLLVRTPEDLNGAADGDLLEPATTAGSLESDGSVSSLLYRITRPVTTLTTYSDGTLERNTGIGFVVGSRFFTVYHNLESGRATARRSRTSFIGDRTMEPLFADPVSDVAVFRRPPGECMACDDATLASGTVVEPDTKVSWMWAYEGGSEIQGGRVLDFAWLGDESSADPAGIRSCTGNLVVLVDRPFTPGSSGSAVIDDRGRVVGIVQGTLSGDGEERGYFKPANCLPPSDR
jgi:hypothetical protein